MSKSFAVGDRVRMVGRWDGFFTDVPGTIANMPGKYTDAVILFDEEAKERFDCGDEGYCPLHDGNGYLEDRCWCIPLSHLRKVTHPQLELFQKEAP